MTVTPVPWGDYKINIVQSFQPFVLRRFESHEIYQSGNLKQEIKIAMKK
jgi:hypothetical protein